MLAAGPHAPRPPTVWPWIASAIAVEAYLVLPYLGDGVYIAGGPGTALNGMVWHVGVIGGLMFRAGMTYARRLGETGPDVPPEATDDEPEDEPDPPDEPRSDS